MEIGGENPMSGGHYRGGARGGGSGGGGEGSGVGLVNMSPSPSLVPHAVAQRLEDLALQQGISGGGTKERLLLLCAVLRGEATVLDFDRQFGGSL